MFIMHVQATVQAGGNAQYEGWKIAEGDLQRKAPGFIKRLMVHSQERPDTYFYLSWWETAEQASTFMNSPEFQALHARHAPRDVFERPMIRDLCDPTFDEAAE
jgi:heme-degrading monooxygenase HmoA